LEGGSNDAIINNNDELVSITSESKKTYHKILHWCNFV